MPMQMARVQRNLSLEVSDMRWRRRANYVGYMIFGDLLEGGTGLKDHSGGEGLIGWTYHLGKGGFTELGGSDCHDPSVTRMRNYLFGPRDERRRRTPAPINLPRRPAGG